MSKSDHAVPRAVEQPAVQDLGMKAADGTWTLRSPTGDTWLEQSPIACLRAEMNSRIPAKVQLQRIYAAIDEDAKKDGSDAETVDRLHHSLAKHGWHPGRSHDLIADILERALAAGPVGPYRNKRLHAKPPEAKPATDVASASGSDEKGEGL